MAEIVLMQPLGNRFDLGSPRVPNGLLAVAAAPVQDGFDVRIIDQKTEPDWRGSLRRSLGPETICVGITCSTGTMIKHALEIAQEARCLNPETPLVWGGPHPTLLPEQTLRHPLVDLVVINEADEIFLDLVRTLADKRDLSQVLGLAYKERGQVKVNPPRHLPRKLDELPPLPYHLVAVDRYSSLAVDNLPSLDLITSRGCPFNCGFCSIPVTSQRRWRAQAVDRIIQEIARLQTDYGVRTFYFADDNFMVDLKRVEALLDALKSHGLDIYWGTQGVRVDTINQMSPRLLDRLEESGCKELSIGVESANPEILQMIEKRIKVDDVLAANRKLTGRSLAVKFNMIIGFPGEDMDSVLGTVRLAIQLHQENPNCWFPFNIFTPFPGTPMFRKAESLGFKAPTALEDWQHLESVGWERWYGHWMSHEDNEHMKSINFTSYLAFPAAAHRLSTPFKRLLFRLYQPLAYLRLKHDFYGLHLERRLID